MAIVKITVGSAGPLRAEGDFEILGLDGLQ
jgi:hypothetical protein